jgi:hypothetical protein
MRYAWAKPDNAICMGNRGYWSRIPHILMSDNAICMGNRGYRSRIPHIYTMPKPTANTRGAIETIPIYTAKKKNANSCGKTRYFLAMPNHHVTRKNESYAHMLTNAYEKSTSSSPKLHLRLSRNSERSKHRWKQEDIKSSVFDAITELANTIMPNSRRFSRILASNTSLHHRIPSIKTALRNV